MNRLSCLGGLVLLNFHLTLLMDWGGNNSQAADHRQVCPTRVAWNVVRFSTNHVLDFKKVESDEVPTLVQEPASLPPRPRPAAEDLSRIQGVWTLDRIEIGGRAVSSVSSLPLARGSDLIFQGEKWLLREPGKVMEPFAAVKLRAEAEPKQIDLVRSDGSMIDGIYKFEGDNVVICLAAAGNLPIRPTRFTTKENIPIALLVCRRLVSPGPNQDLGVSKDGEKRGDGSAVGPMTSEIPDLEVKELTGLTIEQLDRLNKAYQDVFDALYRERQGGKTVKPNDGLKEKEVLRQLIIDLLPAKSRLLKPDPTKPTARPAQYDDDLIQLQNNMRTIVYVIGIKYSQEAKE